MIEKNPAKSAHEAEFTRGRGALDNPSGRFERLQVAPDEGGALPPEFDTDEDCPPPKLRTQVFRDKSRSVISTNDSPDLRMDTTVNPYRGCEHGCIYCYARPTHEYFGMSAGLDFESRIFAKPEAPQLLIDQLSSPKWQPRVISFSGVTDCYQPIERKLEITRRCLQVLADFRNPVAIITKNHLVTRDIDILKRLAEHEAAMVFLSITTLERDVARQMEPRASTPALRLKAVEQLAKAGIPVGVSLAPIVPGLTEHEIPALLKAAADAGARSAFYSIVRLPYGVKDLFETWVKTRFPDRAEKILRRIRDMRGGNLNDPNFGSRMTGGGFYAEQIAQLFTVTRRQLNLERSPRLSCEHFRRDAYSAQPDLFSFA